MVRGSGSVRYRILGGQPGFKSGMPADFPRETEYVVVRASEQDSGWFDDDGFMESQCQSAFEFLSDTIGGIVGGLGGRAAAGVEVTVGSSSCTCDRRSKFSGFGCRAQHRRGSDKSGCASRGLYREPSRVSRGILCLLNKPKLTGFSIRYRF